MKKILVVFISIILIINCIFSFNAVASTTYEDHNCLVISSDTPVLDSSNNNLFSSIRSSLPSSVDLSEDESFPNVRAQVGSSCVAWASTYYQFGYQVAEMNDWNANSDPTKQFSPKWTFNYLSNNCNALSYDDTYEFLSVHGAVKYSDCPTLSLEDNPYELREWYTETSDIEGALRYRVSNYQYLCYSNASNNTPITSPNSQALSSIKNYLNSGHVLTFSTNCRRQIVDQLSDQYDSTLNGEYICTMIDNSIGGYAGHAMAIVGYDDNIKYDLNEDGVIQDYEKGALKIVDSSGTDHMNEGFIWVMYDALNKVSNASLDSSIIHTSFIDNYAYYIIEVDEYPMDLLAEVTLECSSKSSVKMDLGISSETNTCIENSCITLLNRHGERFNYSSTGKTPEEATFVFDFGNLCTYPVEKKAYYLEFTNASSVYPITIENIKIKDRTGKIVVEDANEKTLLNATDKYRYLISMVADVNNDGIISSSDANLIQQYISSQISLTNDQMLIADVDGDNSVSVIDATHINRYIQGMIDEFPAGAYIYLG